MCNDLLPTRTSVYEGGITHHLEKATRINSIFFYYEKYNDL